MRVEVTPLGAGQDIGRSCILAKFVPDAPPQGKRARLDGGAYALVMLDCGFHVGDAAQPFPDFERGLGASRQLDVCLVTHYHIDHVGGLAMLTERFGYAGPVVMSEPTKALSYMMLEETLLHGRRSAVSFSKEELAASVAKCSVIACRETQTFASPAGPVEVTAFLAGHVLGAVMFHVRCGAASLLYTGDFNASADRTLGAAEALPLAPPLRLGLDVLISESTYGATTRGSQRSQEVEFLTLVNDAVRRGGKVLVPAFSLGRVHEMCACLEAHWERVGLAVPIVLQTRNAKKVTEVHKHFREWGLPRCELVGDAGVVQEAPAFKHVRVGEPTQHELTGAGAVVLLATSAMLAGGLSVRAFKLWAGGEDNAVVFPGNCVAGTLGHRVLGLGKTPAWVSVDAERVEVRCKVATVAFSGHTDAKGILKLAHQTQPAHVVLVHGVLPQMEALRRRVLRELPACTVDFPANLATVTCTPRHATVAADADVGVAVEFALRGAHVPPGADWQRVRAALGDAVRPGVGLPLLAADGSTVAVETEQGRLLAAFVRESDYERAAAWLARVAQWNGV